MVQQAAVVIIGAGIIGGSVAYHLAARGQHNVVVLEREAVEVSGSTARSAAGVRHQFSSATNVRLSKYSIERFRHFEEEIGGHAEFHQTGYLFLVNDPATWDTYLENVALQRSLGVRVEVLAPADAATFIPRLNTADLLGATYGPDDGFVDPHGVAMGYLRRARELGVRLERDTAVQSITRDGEGWRLETTTGSWHADAVVNAAGAWGGGVAALAGLSVPIEPIRRNIYVTQPFPQLPTIPLTIDVATGFYMRKEGANVLLGLSRKDQAPGYDTNVDWDWFDEVLEAGFHRFPILEEAALNQQQSWAGLYEVTPDHMPILGRMPNAPSWINAAGFSGHGVMHAPAAGLLIAEEIVDGRAHTISIDALRIERFQGQTVAERNVI